MRPEDEIDWESVYKTFLRSLAADGIDISEVVLGPDEEAEPPVLLFGGPKGKAAKIAIKAAIKTLKGIGEKAWNKAVSKLPLPPAAKKYLGYQFVMKILNIALDFEGEITENIKKALIKAGVPGWLAGIVARAIVTLLL